MTSDDAQRWDQRYSQDERFREYFEPRAFLVEQAGWLPAGGLALDVAMGLGGNAAFLMQHGFKVVGVDISFVALQRARQRLPDLMAAQADLPEFHLPANIFDVILNFYYLERCLWAQYRKWLRPGGILIFETLTQEMLEHQADIDPKYLLQPGELLEGFSDLEILEYHEGDRRSRSSHHSAVASLVARLPASPNLL